MSIVCKPPRSCITTSEFRPRTCGWRHGLLVGVASASLATGAAGADLNVTGNVNVTGHLSAGSISAAVIEGALNVSGPITLTDATATSLTVSGSSSLQSATIQGNAAVAGALSVTGQSTLANAKIQTATVQGALTVNGAVNVSGAAGFGSDVTVGGAGNFGSASIAGATTTGSLAVRGASQLDRLAVSGSSTLAGVDVQGPLSVTGAASFGNLAAEKVRTDDLHVTGNLTVDGGLILPRSFTFGELQTTGASRLNALQVSGEVAMTNSGSSVTLGSSGVQATTAGGARMQLTDRTAALTHGGNGITATADGATRVVATRTATVQGGATTLALTDSGAHLSGSGGAPARLSGIADGVDEHDAVNVGQLNDGLKGVSAGVAMSMAMSQLPIPLSGSNHAFGVALGGFDGQEALALGGTAIMENGVTLRGALSHAGGKTGVGVGVGWSF